MIRVILMLFLNGIAGLPNSNFCVNKKPGYHSLGACLNVYRYCDDNYHPHIYFCKYGYIFATDRCVLAGLLPDCAHKSLEKCIHEPDGVYPIGKCEQEFVVCKKGKRSSHYCETDEMFDAKLGRCIHADHCLDESSGVSYHGHALAICKDDYHASIQLAPGHDETSYVKCKSGKPYFQECNPGYKYDSVSGKCYLESVQSYQFKPLSDQLIEELHFCHHKSDGLYVLGDCANEAFYCYEHKTITVKCQPGNIFAHGECQYDKKCSGRDEYGNTRLTELDHYANLLCQHKLVGSYALDVKECMRHFIQCGHQRGYVQKCVHGHVFEPSSHACVPAKYCHHNHQNQDHVAHKGADHVDHLDSAVVEPCQDEPSTVCKNEYVVCQGTQKYRLKCNPGHIFDPHSYRCALLPDSYYCQKYHPAEPCSHASPTKFLFPYPGDCSKYYYCGSHGPQVKHCAAGMGFDASLHTCNYLEDFECA